MLLDRKGNHQHSGQPQNTGASINRAHNKASLQEEQDVSQMNPNHGRPTQKYMKI